MKIRFERRGGFAGLQVQTTIDTDALPAEEAHAVQNLVESARFFDLPSRLESPPERPDQFSYEVTVETEGRRHTVVTAEQATPENLRPLIRRLTAAARPRKPAPGQRAPEKS